MKWVNDLSEISRCVTARMKPGVFTNNFLTPDEYRAQIDMGALYMHEWGGGLLFLQKREGRHLLTFYVNDLNVLPDVELPPDTVTEIPQKSGTREASPIVSYWAQSGLTVIFERIRLARSAEPVGVSSGAAIAQDNDFDSVYALLRDCFDLRTGCLPTERELREDIQKGHILRGQDGGGVLRVAERSGAMEIRQLAVREDKRGRGVGHALVQDFIGRFGDRKCVTWVREDNAAALRVYTAAGFAADGFKSTVMVRAVGVAVPSDPCSETRPITESAGR